MATLPAKDTKLKSPVTQAKSTPSKTAKTSPTSKPTRRVGQATTEPEAKTHTAEGMTDADYAATDEAGADEPTAAGKPDETLLKPHDRYYGRVMNRPHDAKPLLRTAMGEDMAAQLDWSSWELQNGTFIDESLRGKYTDVLYRTRTLADQDAFVYVLAEHQTRAEPLMAYRMVDYVVKIWARYLQWYPKAKKLPLVVPIVVHSNGTQLWNAARDVGELVDVRQRGRDVFAQVIPRWGYLLDDIATQDLEKLRARELPNRVLVMLQAHKVAPKNPDVVAGLRAVEVELAAVAGEPGGLEEVTVLFRYTAYVSESDPEAIKAFLAGLDSEVKEAIMTAAQQMDAQARAATLLDQLRVKFGELPEAVVEAVHKADDQQVRRWLMLVVTDMSLEEMFELTPA